MSHIGLTLGEDGTHQTLEDIGMMKMFSSYDSYKSIDFNQTKANYSYSNHKGPVT